MEGCSGQVRFLITLRYDYKLQNLKINIISKHKEYFQNVRQLWKLGKKRPRSPYYCKTLIVALNAVEDSIQQLQAALDKEQRTLTTLRREKDDA